MPGDVQQSDQAASTDRKLLVLDFPGRRPEAHVSEMNLDHSGFDCAYALESPLPTVLTTPEYAGELRARQALDRPLAVIAYCATAPLAVAMSGLLTGHGEPVPIVMLDPQQTTIAEFQREYQEVVDQIEGRGTHTERLPLLDVERRLSTPEVLVEQIGADLRLRAKLAFASHGFDGADVDGPVESLVGVYVEWLTFLIAAHHDEPTAPRGPILQVISRRHPDDASWLGAADIRTARISCDRPELAINGETRAAVLDFLHRFAVSASVGMGREG